MSSTLFPTIPVGLIAILERQYPDKAPREDVGSVTLGVRAGEQRIIDFLKMHYEKQQRQS